MFKPKRLTNWVIENKAFKSIVSYLKNLYNPIAMKSYYYIKLNFRTNILAISWNIFDVKAFTYKSLK